MWRNISKNLIMFIKNDTMTEIIQYTLCIYDYFNIIFLKKSRSALRHYRIIKKM